MNNMEPGDAEVKGVVIITLPPPNNPSIGKTITVYAVSNEPSPQTHHQNPQIPSPINPPSNSQNPPSVRSVFFGARKSIAVSLLGISLFAFILLNSVSLPLPFRLDSSNERDDDRRESDTFILPLFPKFGSQDKSMGDIELKLGRFVEKDNVLGAGTDGVGGLVPGYTVSRVESSTILPLKGNVFPHGLYYSRLLIGNPPRSYFLDMDTGSDLTWVQCDAPCTSCAKGPHSLYKPTRSKLVSSKSSLCGEVQRNLKSSYCDTCQQCDYEIEYADHSSSMGVLVRDELNIKSFNGSLAKSNLVFGCAYDQQGSLLNSLIKTDGLLGLSRSKVSLLSQLASQGIMKNVFGHCITSHGPRGGYMFLGGDLVPNRIVAWIPMVNSLTTSFYLAEAARISYGSNFVNMGQSDGKRGQVVFDSGSSYTYFPGQTYSNLVASLEESAKGRLARDTSDSTLPLCWRAESPVKSFNDLEELFKPLTLHFGSKWWLVYTKFQIPPEGYLIINDSGSVCLGILDGSRVHDGSTIILGDISLQGKLVIYDNEKLRIGWAESDCRKPKRSRSLPFPLGMDFAL